MLLREPGVAVAIPLAPDLAGVEGATGVGFCAIIAASAGEVFAAVADAGGATGTAGAAPMFVVGAVLIPEVSFLGGGGAS